MRLAINATIIKEKSVLLVKKQEYWILPGGKPNDGESDRECLCREVSEELSGTQIGDIRYYQKFKGKSPHKGDIIIARVYFAYLKGELKKPSSEISDAKFFSINNYCNVSELTSLIIENLKQDGYL